MGKVILGMTISLDGFVNDKDGSVSRLYPDMAAFSATEEMLEEMRMTGAVVMGRHSYDMGNGDFTGYEFQVPLFVVTHHIPEQAAKGENENLKFVFVTDGVESAIAQAKTTAGDKNVTIVGGADIFQQTLRAGLADELHIDIAPVLLGAGLRLFENLDSEPIELEQILVGKFMRGAQLKYRLLK